MIILTERKISIGIETKKGKYFQYEIAFNSQYEITYLIKINFYGGTEIRKPLKKKEIEKFFKDFDINKMLNEYDKPNSLHKTANKLFKFKQETIKL